MAWTLLVVFITNVASLRADPRGTTLYPDKFPPVSDPVYGSDNYASLIVGLHQKSLFDYPPDADVYRFIFSDAWDRGRLALIVRQDGYAHLDGIEPASHSVQGRLGIVAAESRDLTPAEWSRFNALLQRADFWRAPTKIDHEGLDGYIYLIEARVRGHYHYAIRWVPEAFPDDKAFYQLGTWLDNLIPDVGTATTNDGYDITTKDGTPISTRH